jgi:hypothetical protein
MCIAPEPSGDPEGVYRGVFFVQEPLDLFTVPLARACGTYSFQGVSGSLKLRPVAAPSELGGPDSRRRDLGAYCRVQRALSGVLGHGQAVCWGGMKCCGLLPRPPL